MRHSGLGRVQGSFFLGESSIISLRSSQRPQMNVRGWGLTHNVTKKKTIYTHKRGGLTHNAEQ